MNSSRHVDICKPTSTGPEIVPPTDSNSFLKIPRIRLKGGKDKSKSAGTSPSSPPQQSPLDSSPKNNKFSYIENSSHLVNPIMIQQQQQRIIRNKNQFAEDEDGGHGDNSNGDQQRNEHGEQVQQQGGKVLIKPKKLPNPIKESVAMQSIHRELLLNQKIGRSVLNHKTELQRALEKLATKSVDNEEEQQTPHPPTLPTLPQQSIVSHNNKKDEFQRILDARAKQIEDQKCFVDGVTKAPVIRESEFEKIHKRITSNAPK